MMSNAVPRAGIAGVLGLGLRLGLGLGLRLGLRLRLRDGGGRRCGL